MAARYTFSPTSAKLLNSQRNSLIHCSPGIYESASSFVEYTDVYRVRFVALITENFRIKTQINFELKFKRNTRKFLFTRKWRDLKSANSYEKKILFYAQHENIIIIIFIIYYYY